MFRVHLRVIHRGDREGIGVFLPDMPLLTTVLPSTICAIVRPLVGQTFLLLSKDVLPSALPKETAYLLPSINILPHAVP